MANNTAPFVFGGTTNIATTSSGSGGGGGGDDFDRLETASNMIVNALRQDEDSKESDPYRRLLMNPTSVSSGSSTPTPFSPSSTTSTSSTTTGGSHLYRPTRGSTDEWMTTLGNDLMMASSSASASASASTGSRDTTAAANTSDRRGTTSTRTSTSPSQQQRQQQHQQQRSPLFHLGGGSRGAGGRASSSSSSSRPNLYYGGSGQRGGDRDPNDGNNQFHDARSSPVDHGSSAEQHHQQRQQQQQQQQLKLLETSILPTSTILYESSVPMPEYLSKLITTEAKVVSLMGLLPECSLAWISVDYKLYLWHYDSTSSRSSSSITGKAPITTSSNVIVDFCETHVPSRQCISNVGIAKAKRRVFSQEIEWVIVVVTYEEVLLYALRDMTRGGGFSTKGGNGFGPNGSLQLLPTDFVVPTEDVSMVSITSTSTGRLFLGGTDGHLYEMMYEQQCSVSNFGGVGTRWVSSSATTNNTDTDYEDYGEGMEEEEEGWTSYGKRLLKDTFLGSSRGGMPDGGSGGPSSVKRRRVCSKLKHTDGSSGTGGSSLFSSVVPTFLQKLALTSSSATGSRSLIDMTIDEERGVLHTLSENGTLCIYELGDDTNGSGNLAGGGGSSSNGGFFFGTTTSTTTTPPKNTSLSLPLLTSIQLKDVSKKYLEALKRHAVYTNSSDYIFGGGPTAALRGLGGGGGGATGRSLNAVECASTLLKLSELASSSTNAASTTRGGTTTSSFRGGTGTSNAVDVLKPTRIFVVPCQTSRQLFAIVVTQGGLRYYLNLPSCSDDNWKQRTLCHIRSPPSSMAAILMSSSSSSSQQSQSLTMTNKYRFDEEGMVPGIMQPLTKPSSTTSATSTRPSTSPSSTPSPYRRSTGPTGTTGSAPMAVPVVASHLLAQEDVFVMGLDGDSLLNATTTNNLNPSSSDGIVGILSDITHRRTEEHVIGADSAMTDGARSGGNAATNTTTRVGIMSPPGTNTTGGATAGTTTTTAGGGVVVPRHTIAPGINEVVTCPLPNNTFFMGRTTNHDLASLALLPGGKICSIAGSTSCSKSATNHPWSTTTTGSTSDTSMMEWLVQRSVTPSTKDDQWKGSLALGHLPPCPKVVRQSPIQQFNTVTGDIVHYKKYKLRMDGTGGGSGRNNHKGYVVPSPTTTTKKPKSASPLVLHECYQFSKAVPLSSFVKELYHFIYKKANDLSSFTTESNSMYILNAAGVHRLRVRSVMELYKELVFKLPSSIFFGSSSSSSSRSISTSTSASRGGLCRTFVQQFIRAYGQEEVCVMSLILAIGGGISSTEELVKRGRQLAMSYGGRPSYNSQMAAAVTAAAAAAARNANESSSSSPPNGSRTSTTGQTNRASGGSTSNGTSNAMIIRYGSAGSSSAAVNPYSYYVPAAFESSSLLKGVTKLMARLLRPIWLKPLVVVTSPVGTSSTSSRMKQRNAYSSSRRSTSGGSILRTRQSSSSGKSSLSQSQRPPRPYAVEFLLYNNGAFMQMYRPLKKLELLLRDMFKHAIEQVPGSHSHGTKEDEMMDIDAPTKTFGSSHHLGYMSSALRQYYHNPQQQQVWQQQQQPYGRTGTTAGVAAVTPMNDVALADLLEKESLHNLYRLLSRTTQLLDLFQLLFRTSVDSTTTEVEWGLLHQLTVYQLVCAPESSDRITALIQSLLLTNNTSTSTIGGSGRPYPYTNDIDDSTTHLKYQLAQTISTKCYLWFDQGDLLAQKAYNVTMDAKRNLPGSIDFGSCAAEAAKLWTQAAACWKSAKVVMGQVSLSTLAVSPSTSSSTTTTSTPGKSPAKATSSGSTSNVVYDNDNDDSVVMEMISFPTPLGGSEFGSYPLVKACLSLYELGKINATVDVCLTCASNFGGSAMGTAGESYVTTTAVESIAGPSTSSRPFGGVMTGSSRLDNRAASTTPTNSTSNVTYEWEMGLYKSGSSSSRSTTTSINEPVWSSMNRNPTNSTMFALVPQQQVRGLSSAPQRMRNKDVCRFCYSLVLYFLNLLLSNQDDRNGENNNTDINQNGYYYNNMGSIVNRRGTTTTTSIGTTTASSNSSPADQMLSVCSNSKDVEFHKMLYMFLLCDNRYTNYLLRLQTPFLEHWLKAESWLVAGAVPPARGSSTTNTNDAAALAVLLPSGMELLYEHYTLQDKFGCACCVMEEMARSPNPTSTSTRRLKKRILTLSDRIDCITRAMSAAQSSLRQQTSNGGIPSGDVSLPQTKLSELEDLLDIARIQYRLLQLVNDSMILNENVIESNRMDDGADDNDVGVVVDQEEALVKQAKEVGMITQQEYFVLGHELVSATDLLYQYASRLEFYDVCLIIMNSCRESNEDMIHTLWHNILGQELEHVWSSSREDLPSLLADICNDGDSSMFEQQDNGGASGQTRRNEEDRFENGSWVKRLSKRITSLGRELFGKDADFTFPVPYLILTLEQLRVLFLTLTNNGRECEDASGCGPWTMECIAQANVPYDALLQSYDTVLQEWLLNSSQDPNMDNRMHYFQCVGEVLCLWIAAADQSNSSRYDDDQDFSRDTTTTTTSSGISQHRSPGALLRASVRSAGLDDKIDQYINQLESTVVGGNTQQEAKKLLTLFQQIKQTIDRYWN